MNAARILRSQPFWWAYHPTTATFPSLAHAPTLIALGQLSSYALHLPVVQCTITTKRGKHLCGSRLAGAMSHLDAESSSARILLSLSALSCRCKGTSTGSSNQENCQQTWNKEPDCITLIRMKCRILCRGVQLESGKV